MAVERGRVRPHRSLGLEFNKLWAASAVSNLGDGVSLLAAPLLAAALTRDPALVAGLSFAQRGQPSPKRWCARPGGLPQLTVPDRQELGAICDRQWRPTHDCL